jgi:DNA-directed RNA polymerase specialized sigma24 family protein
VVSLVKEASAFVEGRGRKVVLRQLRAHSLPSHLFDDLVQEALLAALVAERQGVEPDSVPAFVSRLVQRRARDMLRGRRRRPEGHQAAGHPEDDAWAAPIDTLKAPDRPEDEAVSNGELAQMGPVVEGIRRDLRAHLGHHPTRAAGALVVLAIVHGDALPAPDCPTPAGGVAQSEAASWAGLFYGGPARCFPTADDPEDAAMRKRRSRALLQLKDLLRDVATGLGAILEADDA